MKKTILSGLLALLVVTNFSFTSTPQQTGSGIAAHGLFKKYYVKIKQTVPLEGTFCSLTVSFIYAFNWNGPGTAVTNVQPVTFPTFEVTCPGPNNYARGSEITKMEFDPQTGHCIDIVFAPTKDATIDTKISSPGFLELVKTEINTQTDNQKAN